MSTLGALFSKQKKYGSHYRQYHPRRRINCKRIATRNLLKYKGYTIINVLGLAIGITGVILMMLFVRNEFSYDKFHSKSDRIYRLWQFEKYADQISILSENLSTKVAFSYDISWQILPREGYFSA